MKTTISNAIIRELAPCYDPFDVVKDENEELPVSEWIIKYSNSVKSQGDIIWLICREDFMSSKDLRLFAVWCAREALKLIENPDERSINACNEAEKYVNGESNDVALSAAWSAALYAARSAALYAALYAAESNARYAARYAALYAARYAARSAAESDARSAQIDKLLTYFV